MKLYHFTAEHMLQGILQQGITRGVFTIISGKGIKLIPCVQWLTADGDPNNQSWATRELIEYDRTAVRITVSIPKTSRSQLCRAHDLLPALPEEGRKLITDWPGSENWYLFFGTIPSGWIREVLKRRTK